MEIGIYFTSCFNYKTIFTHGVGERALGTVIDRPIQLPVRKSPPEFRIAKKQELFPCLEGDRHRQGQPAHRAGETAPPKINANY